MKSCSRCRTLRPATSFYNDVSKSDGKTSRCKACLDEQTRERQQTPEGRVTHSQAQQRYYAKLSTEQRARSNRAKTTEGRKRSRDYMFLWNLRNRYGMTKDEYDDLLAVQANKCAICDSPFTKRPHIDHDHKTGEVRGLLCGDCNRGLGSFHDDRALLKKARAYLRR